MPSANGKGKEQLRPRDDAYIGCLAKGGGLCGHCTFTPTTREPCQNRQFHRPARAAYTHTNRQPPFKTTKQTF